MPTSNPKISVTFNEGDAEMMYLICKKKKISMPELVRIVMVDWLEEYEDMLLSKRAEKVEKKCEKAGRKTISHLELWNKF